jgi:glutamyl/glutaminyl-tRNA synthetase
LCTAGEIVFYRALSPTRFHKTRIAPTPSGYLHEGNAAAFLLTAALSSRYQARVLLRIDDLDEDRVRPHFIRHIFETLAALKIDWQEGPRNESELSTQWSQRHRLPFYMQALDQLREEGKVFACTCSRSSILALGGEGSYPGTCLHKALPLDTPGASWRLNTEKVLPLTVKRPGLPEWKGLLPSSQQFFIVCRKDGIPAYHLASLVDDVHFAIDLLVRGEDLWESTLAQHYLAGRLGFFPFTEASFVHHPLLLNTEGEKLSKSSGAKAVEGFDGGLDALRSIAESWANTW